MKTQRPQDLDLPGKYILFRTWLMNNGFGDVGMPIPRDFEDVILGRAGLHSAILVGGELRLMQAIYAFAAAFPTIEVDERGHHIPPETHHEESTHAPE